MRNFRRFLRGRIGRVVTAAIMLTSLHAFAEPQNYITALEKQRQHEAEIRAIAAKLNVDPEFLLHPEGRKTFDFRSLFAWAQSKLGIKTTDSGTQQPLDIAASIARVKTRYGLVAADATIAKIADLVRMTGEPAAAHAKKYPQIRGEMKSLLRVIDRDLLPQLPDAVPAVAHQRDAQMRASLHQLQQNVKQVLSGPGALDDANLETTLAAVKNVVGSTLVLRATKRRWTKDPFPLRDTYKTAPKKTLGPAPIQTHSTPALVATSVAPHLTPRSQSTIDPGVAAMATTLKTPAKIFTWVHDKILWESYSGIAKGAAGTLAERRGNDWDQAVLLRDMLTSQGYQASLEWGHVTLPIARAMNLAGTEDPLQAANLLATGGLDGVVIMNGTTPAAMQMTHAWVQALIPYVPNRGATVGTADTWVRMDPSFKRFDYQAGIAINGNVPWSEDGFLASGVVRAPEDYYADQIWSYIRANNLNCQNLAQVPKTATIHAEKYPFVPSTLTAHIDDTPQTSATNPDDQVQSISVALVDGNGATVGTWNTSIADVWGKKIAITFPPATADDAAIIQSYGGLYNTPAYLINLKPLFSVDDVEVAEGTPLPAGAALDMNVTFHQPNVADDFAHHDVTAGESHTLVLDPGAFPDSLVQSRVDRFKTLTPGTDPSTTEGLFLVGLRYMQHADDGLAFAAGMRWQRAVKRVFEADVRQEVKVAYNVSGAPLRLSAGEENIDVSRLSVGIVPINNDLSNRMDAFALAGLQSSYLEGAIWEEMQSQQGISAAKALMLAKQAGQTIYTVNASNVDTVLATVSLSSDVEDEVRGAVAQGRIAKIASSNISLNRWSGTGYILRDPNTGAATYPISGNLAGGSTTGEIVAGLKELLGTETWLSGTLLGELIQDLIDVLNGYNTTPNSGPSTTQSDPVNLSSGNMYQEVVDISIVARGIPISLTRTYNSRSAYNGPFGYGWTFNYGEMIVPNGDGSVTYRETDGTEHVFTVDGAGNFVSPAGKHITLTVNGSGYTMRFKDATQFTFGPNGLLATQSDLNGNMVTIQRDASGNITAVTDATGRTVLTFTVTNGKITQVTDLGNRTVQYGYAGEDLVSVTDTAGKVWSMAYDTQHNMTALSDPLGNTQAYDYDGDDRLMHHVNATGAEEFFQYDIAGRQSVLTDRRGGDRLITYDDLGRATLESDPAGNVVKASFDADNNRTNIIDSRGNATAYAYDGLGNVTQQTSPDGGVTTTSYDASSRPLVSTDALGVTTTNAYDPSGNLLTSTKTIGGVTQTVSNVYDSHGQLTSTTDANGGTTSMSWNDNGSIASRTDAANNTTTMTTDALGRITAIKDPAGNTSSVSYDGKDRMATMTDPYGNQTSYTYDDAGRRIQVTSPRGAIRYTYDTEGQVLSVTDGLGNTTSTTYDTAGDVISRTDPRGNTIRFEYDLAGRVTRMVDANGGVTTYGYCAALGGDDTSCASCGGGGGSFCLLTDPNGNTIQQQFDAMGRVIAVTDSLSHSMFMQYDKAGRKTVETDANGNTTKYGYDEAGRLVSVIEASGAVTQYTYDGNGNKLTRKDANGHVWSYQYDALNRLVKETDPLGRSMSYTYDGIGNLKTKTDGNGKVTTYTYNVRRLTNVAYADGTADTFTYDSLGRRTGMANANVSYTYGYDQMNRVVSLLNQRTNFRATYAYDAAGNKAQQAIYVNGGTTPYAKTQYVYDAKNRLTSIQDSIAGTFGLTYDAMDRRTGLQYPNGITTSYAYDKGYRLTAMVSKNAAGAVADAWSYQYDPVGNRTAKTDMNGAIETYAYDSVDRLTKATYGDASSESFTYDAVGNRLTRTDTTSTTATYSYDVGNQLLKAGSDTFTYDGNGNMVTKTTANGTTALTYNPRNLPTMIAAPDGTENNLYGPTGERISMAGASIENGQVYPEYDLAGNPFLDTDGGMGVWTYRVYGPGVDECLSEYRRNNNRLTYQLHDALGSVTAVTFTDGTLAYRSTYKAFGQMTRGSYDLPTTRLGYTSRETSVGGLMQYRSRYYDPASGRFVQQDTLGGREIAPPSLHRFVYVANRPTVLTDPTGHGSKNPFPGDPSTKTCGQLIGSIIWYTWDIERRMSQLKPGSLPLYNPVPGQPGTMWGHAVVQIGVQQWHLLRHLAEYYSRCRWWEPQYGPQPDWERVNAALEADPLPVAFPELYHFLEYAPLYFVGAQLAILAVVFLGPYFAEAFLAAGEVYALYQLAGA